jgi:two-component system, NarL family, nitrate/nitrite response regulator NarL
MAPGIRVAILDDHQSIVDGYLYRLDREPDIEVIATAVFGEELEPLLAAHLVHVLLLDLNVPTSSVNPQPYPVLHTISRLLQKYPALAVLVISMHLERPLIKAVMAAGASGYVLKDDRTAIKELPTVVRSVATGGVYFSQQAYRYLHREDDPNGPNTLTVRQLEALSLSAAYPDEPGAVLAKRLGLAHSTVRTLLSEAYIRLDVGNRAAAIAKAAQLGLIPPPGRPAPPSGIGADEVRE